MRWPIRNQILVPFATILLAVVATIAISAAVLAARRSERETIAQLNQVIQTLGQSSFPYSQNVLEKMRGLSGAEFVAFGSNKTVVASTLPLQNGLADSLDAVPASDQLESLDESPTVEVGDSRYLAATIKRPGPSGTTTLLVLYPETSWKQTRWEAAVPPLAVGAGTVLLMVFVSAWLAQRFGSRIRSVQQQVAAIAAGDFREVTTGYRHDEIQDLVDSVNRMSAQLKAMQKTIRESERSRLLGQLAGGLAHQLRNAVTGARMAIQIHRKRCSADSNDESLDVALRQLSLTEEQVKGLLTLSKGQRPAPVSHELRDLLNDLTSLISPACEHANVEFQHSVPPDPDCVLEDSESVRAAVLNLMLNAIEAANPGGRVNLDVRIDGPTITFDVADTGSGPPQELADSLFDVFVSGKPEGVGLGLALAKQVADDLGGSISWNRADGRTHFRLSIPYLKSQVENRKSQMASP